MDVPNRAKARAGGNKTRSGARGRPARWLPWAGAGVAVAAVIAGAALLHGRGVGATTGGSAALYSGVAAASAPSASPPAAVPAGAGYRLTSIGGQAVAFPQGRATLLYFMSASCSSCWQGNSQIARIYPRLRHMAQVLSLDVTPQVDTASQVEEMAHSTGAVWPQAFAAPSILTRYRIRYLDSAVVLSRTGKVLYDGGIPSDRRLLALMRRASASA